MTAPKIGLWDTEWTPATSYTWSGRPKYLPNDMLVEQARLICWGFRWLDKKSTRVVDERIGRREMLVQLRDLLDEVDILISYNGKSFDTRKVNSEFMKEGIDPPSPYKQIDLYREIKREASFYSHKLGFIADQIVGDTKVDTGGFGLWKAVMAGDKAAWTKMRRYQKQDVDLLFDLFMKVRPWIKMPHPIQPGEGKCRVCASTNLQRRGYAMTLNGAYQRYQCQGCKSWSRGNSRLDLTNMRNVT